MAKVICVEDVRGRLTAGTAYEFTLVKDHASAPGTWTKVTDDRGKQSHWYGYRFRAWDETIDGPMYPHRGLVPSARANDPATSKAAAKGIKVKKASIKDVIIDLLLKYKTGLTGQEIAEYSGFRLNSITPRFAELRRANLVTDSGRQRSLQIVWQLKGRMV